MITVKLLMMLRVRVYEASLKSDVYFSQTSHASPLRPPTLQVPQHQGPTAPKLAGTAPESGFFRPKSIGQTECYFSWPFSAQDIKGKICRKPIFFFFFNLKATKMSFSG